MNYRCEATSLKGFVHQVAVVYLTKGYHWFVQGRVPEGKDPREVDAKIVEKYRLDVSETTRCRRKKLGKANVALVRFGRDYVLLATKGRHKFYQLERRTIRCASDSEEGESTTPIRIANYSISRRREGRIEKGRVKPKYRSHIQIDWEHYKELKAMFEGLSCRRSTGDIAQLFYELPFEPYAPIRRQVAGLRAMVNRRRRRQGMQMIPKESFPAGSYPVKVFEPKTVVDLWSPIGKWWYEVRRAA